MGPISTFIKNKYTVPPLNICVKQVFDPEIGMQKIVSGKWLEGSLLPERYILCILISKLKSITNDVTAHNS